VRADHRVSISVTTYKYWLVGSLTNNVNEATYLAALINALGSVGSTFGFVVSKMNFSLVGACAINLALFFISVPGLAWVAYTRVTETSVGTSLTGLADFDETGSSLGDAGSLSEDIKIPVPTASEK
jgi:hypothetical protein